MCMSLRVRMCLLTQLAPMEAPELLELELRMVVSYCVDAGS